MIYKIINDDCIKAMREMPANSVDAVVTDPPYELGFMGKKWDKAGVAFDPATWEEVLRVLKPGGYLLAFGHSRLFHRLAVAIEDAGFELRDTIMWVYGSGFPKSMNAGKAIEAKLKKGKSNSRSLRAVEQEGDGEPYELKGRNNGILGEERVYDRKTFEPDTNEAKQWEGYGTALKPAYEPIVMARKPIEGTVAENVLKYGTGAINIDESRIPANWEEERPASWFNSGKSKSGEPTYGGNLKTLTNSTVGDRLHDEGRFPANLIHDGSEEVVSLFPDSKGAGKSLPKVKVTGYGQGTYNYEGGERIPFEAGEGSAARFFYAAKASKKDRDGGLGHLPDKTKVWNGQSDVSSTDIKDVEKRFTTIAKNTHPTVKPTSLMQYLIRMVAPPGAVVLDPFMGSGSTGKAAALLNREYTFVGIDMEEEYCQIAEARILDAVGQNLL